MKRGVSLPHGRRGFVHGANVRALGVRTGREWTEDGLPLLAPTHPPLPTSSHNSFSGNSFETERYSFMVWWAPEPTGPSARTLSCTHGHVTGDVSPGAKLVRDTEPTGRQQAPAHGLRGSLQLGAELLLLGKRGLVLWLSCYG